MCILGKSGGVQYIYSTLDFIKSDNVNLNYTYHFKNNRHFSATAFGQFYENILNYSTPVFGSISVLDNFGDDRGSYFYTDGKAKSIGFEANINQNNHNGWFWQLNMTVFNATFKDGAGTRSLAYNSKYIFNAYIGKECEFPGAKYSRPNHSH